MRSGRSPGPRGRLNNEKSPAGAGDSKLSGHRLVAGADFSPISIVRRARHIPTARLYLPFFAEASHVGAGSGILAAGDAFGETRAVDAAATTAKFVASTIIAVCACISSGGLRRAPVQCPHMAIVGALCVTAKLTRTAYRQVKSTAGIITAACARHFFLGRSAATTAASANKSPIGTRGVLLIRPA